MADYPIETKIVSKNGWFTPAESNAYYGMYSRDNYITHWWGAPGTVGTHDQTVAYIAGTAQAGQMSVNFVVSDAKITMLVDPKNVSWGAEGGNATGINVEHDPALGAEGYRKAGWLKWHLEQVFGKQLGIKKHSNYFATACPGTIDVNRIESECAALRKGGGMFMVDKGLLENYYIYLMGRLPDDSAIKSYTGKPADVVFQELVLSAEYKSRAAKLGGAQDKLNQIKAIVG